MVSCPHTHPPPPPPRQPGCVSGLEFLCLCHTLRGPAQSPGSQSAGWGMGDEGVGEVGVVFPFPSGTTGRHTPPTPPTPHRDLSISTPSVRLPHVVHHGCRIRELTLLQRKAVGSPPGSVTWQDYSILGYPGASMHLCVPPLQKSLHASRLIFGASWEQDIVL